MLAWSMGSTKLTATRRVGDTHEGLVAASRASLSLLLDFPALDSLR
jgi:hypothetical protein